MEEHPYAKHLSLESREKREQWNEVHSIANHQFFSRVQDWDHLPESDASVARYLEKQKSKGHTLSPADETFLEACRASKHAEWKPSPGAEKYEKSEAAIAKAVNAERPFGYLPEKVCSLATYCRDRKKEGLSLTPVQERFFAQLVNVYHKDPEVPQYEKQFLDNVAAWIADSICQFLNKSVEKELFVVVLWLGLKC